MSLTSNTAASYPNGCTHLDNQHAKCATNWTPLQVEAVVCTI